MFVICITWEISWSMQTNYASSNFDTGTWVRNQAPRVYFALIMTAGPVETPIVSPLIDLVIKIKYSLSLFRAWKLTYWLNLDFSQFLSFKTPARNKKLASSMHEKRVGGGMGRREGLQAKRAEQKMFFSVLTLRTLACLASRLRRQPSFALSTIE